MEKSNRPSFFDLAKQGRKSKTRDFLRNVDQIIDWRPIQNIIHKHYTKGHSARGQPVSFPKIGQSKTRIKFDCL